MLFTSQIVTLVARQMAKDDGRTSRTRGQFGEQLLNLAISISMIESRNLKSQNLGSKQPWETQITTRDCTAQFH